MAFTLDAIQSHPKLKLQIVATGMHLDAAHGPPLAALCYANFKATQTVPWPAAFSPIATAAATGQAISSLAHVFRELKPHIVLVVGDRVEAFAAAAAAHICQIPLAHVHGGDRALGQIDDSLRHAITKLSHVHFPATLESASRIAQLGEERFRIHNVGSPATDRILASARPLRELRETFHFRDFRKYRYAVLVLHPTSADDRGQARLAKQLLHTTLGIGLSHVYVIYPNNDPGSAGIIRAWKSVDHYDKVTLDWDMPRSHYLGLLKHAALLIGNSSSGIIEAASFGTPVINIGDRQKGRERNANVIDVPANAAAICRALKKVLNNGRPIRFARKNIYGSGRTSEKIARILATIPLDERLRRKLISY